MSGENGFVWYASGGDKTGPALGRALEFSAGKKTPALSKVQVVVGWGCKPGTNYNKAQWAQAIAEGHLRVLNHPDAVQANRDKLGTLKRLAAGGVSVPGFVEFDPRKPKIASEKLIPAAVKAGEISFPMILLTKGNRGEPLFCYNQEDLAGAMAGNSGREHPLCYARTYDYGLEFRIHVFRDHTLFAQKKELTEDPIQTIAGTLVEKLQKGRESRKARKLSSSEESVAKEMGALVAGDLLRNGAHFRKSTKMGWAYLNWELDLISPEVAELAIDAIDVLNLDMGAVSVSYVEDVPRVLSVTTTPALDRDQMAAYVAEIREFAGGKDEPRTPSRKKVDAEEQPAAPEMVAEIYHRIRGLSAEKAREVLASLPPKAPEGK